MRVHISSQLFCGTLVRAPLIQELIIWGTINREAIFLSAIIWGTINSEGQLSDGAIIPGAIVGGQLSGGSYPGGNCPAPHFITCYFRPMNIAKLLRIVFLQNTSKSTLLQMIFKVGVLKSFENFTGKHLCWSLILKNVQAKSL